MELKIKQKLGHVEQLVYRELPEVLKKAAPSSVYELLDDFRAEYERFKDFVVYRSLVGKNTVGLGGSFGSGKTGFLNALMGTEGILLEDASPSASVPVYLVHGSGHAAKAINVLGDCIELDPEMICMMDDGFGSVEDEAEQSDIGVSLGHILKNIVLETKLQKYENLVFLDTPGYSAPESEAYCGRTDEKTARRQLNAADFILWFLPVDGLEMLPDSDICFLKKLSPEIPIMVICSKANQRTQEQRDRIKAAIEEQVLQENLNVDKVFFFDARTPKGLNTFGIYKVFTAWNQLESKDDTFARGFRQIFTECRAYYRKKLEEADAEIGSLTSALLCLDNSKQTAACLERIKVKSQQEKALMEQQEKELLCIRNAFYKEIKEVADEAGIHMPENMEAVEEKAADTLQILRHYNKQHKRQANPELREDILGAFQDIQPAFQCEPGGRGYKGMVLEILEKTAFPEMEEIQFGADINYGVFL